MDVRRLVVVAQAMSLIENNYVDNVDGDALVYGAVDGMVGVLDRHSQFFDPEAYLRLREDTEGEYAGAGMEVERGDDGGRHVVDVYARSPAARAGILVGDRIASVDGDPDGSIRGRAGTTVEIGIVRDGWQEPRVLRVVRRRIRIPAIETRSLGSGVEYVRLRQFQSDTSAALRRRLAETSPEALVLDLRGNPGGLYDEAVAVADVFLDSGVIVMARGRRGRTERARATRGHTWRGLPVAVVIDGQSASASEIVAGALQDHGRAVIIGAPSFGKGSVQTFLDLDDGSGIKLTTARYFTPSGASIQGRGIQPDVLVDPKDDPISRAYQTVQALRLSNQDE